MTLSMDFHSNKDSAEIIKAVEQGNSINDLAELFLCITIKLIDWTQLHRRTYKETSWTESNVVNESLRNWQTVWYFNQVKLEEDRYARPVQDSVDAKRAYRHRMNSGNAVETLIMFLGLLSASFLAVRKSSSGDASVGSFVTLGTFWATMMYPLEMIAWSYSNITSTFIDAERLFQLLRTKPSVSDKLDLYELDVSTGKVKFRNVQFSESGFPGTRVLFKK
jgi:ABC-type transport system involved in Fe-S cluster assembly fused permease/ATPase subunit